MDGDTHLQGGLSFVSERGEITLPNQVIRDMNLRPGDEVAFHLNDAGELIMTKADPALPDRFERALGVAGPGMTTDEVMALTRGTP